MALGLFVLAVLVSSCGSQSNGTNDNSRHDEDSTEVHTQRTQDQEIKNYVAKLSTYTGCSAGERCVVVPYSHCCGNTKIAINEKELASWWLNPELHEYPGSCSNMGRCSDDSGITKAYCETENPSRTVCRLEWPKEDSK